MYERLTHSTASNWVDRGQPPEPELGRVLSYYLDLGPEPLETRLRPHVEAIRGMVEADATEVRERQQWGLAQANRSPLWATLASVLALGGRFEGDTAFSAPYVFKGTPGDGFETLVVLGRNVLVRAQPTATSAVIDTLSFEAVARWREGRSSSAAGWEPVRTSKARTGWVPAHYLRSPIDYRAGFVRRGGEWWLRALVAGD